MRHPQSSSGKSSIQIAVASHRPYRMPEDAMYLPLHVGRALHPDTVFGPNFIGDDTGDNISTLNNYFSELTGLYWIWKNSTADYRGLVHYRRHFATASSRSRFFAKDRFSKIVGESEISQLFQHTDIILPRKRNYVIETVHSHYSHTFNSIQLDETKAILQEQQPEYIPAFNHVMQGKTAHMFNMLVMKDEKLDEYCSWLFPILFELQSRIDPAQYDAFNARYPGRISEMLLDVWINTCGYSYLELPVVNIEPVNWSHKGKAFLDAKFRGKKYTASF